MIYIHFIINPISGSAKHNLATSYLLNQFPKEQYRIEVDYTKQKKHAIELTKAAISQNPDYIVACGGDGTINEVASCLVGTTIKLGIIPVGSGNGLASNLNIPRDFAKAIAIIKKGITTSMDVGKINQYYFFSNMGIGIDALIIKKYERSGNRTLSSYVKAALSSSFEYKAQQAVVSYEDKVIKINPFMLFISNSNEMGYNMSLTPKASLSDGILDMVIIPELTFFEKLSLGFNVLRNSIEKFKKAQHTYVRKVHIEMPQKIFIDAQIDGEMQNLKTNVIEVSILPKGLEVLV
ncbi:diacylglycerol kinase family lipid kinase [Flavobacterium sp. ANB]|uniref:diacylglycerol/lipid kinase family protein n=1 Tax=unclassified Flavobacterium TaxID=196869 RepID=UPI0012B83FAB|nr:MULTISPECIES: diacylglycerol kinase family protein [unclassified Flavobacterium]MBF4516116.1 diacylglycerol kinase family lipid kinase [Flavobacterium sp. ANB]MTD72213.1 YegS/Rv2252/BmrU family lipid kinase [Flavobacterium sp. LC2016-13]